MKKTAAVLLIGDELLSGRTQDLNFQPIATFLGAQGIDVVLGKIIGDQEREIIANVRELSAAHDYLFTTGGIGPTHDDITAAAVAKAAGVPLVRNGEAAEMIRERFALNRPGQEVGAARLRMADMPEGAALIANAVSGAPGFIIKNIYVLAGVPMICASMLDALAQLGLAGGEKWLSITLRGAKLAEGDIAHDLGAIQEANGGVKIGSYPHFDKSGATLRIVLRAPESLRKNLSVAEKQVAELMKKQGIQPFREG